MAENSESGLTSAQAVKEATDKITSTAIESGNTLSITSAKIDIQVQDYSPLSPTTVTPSNGMAISLPAGVISGGSDPKLVSVVYKAQLYQALSASDTNQVPRTLTLEIYADSTKQVVSGLAEGIEMTYPADASDQVASSKLALVASGSLPLDDVTCLYYNATSNQLSSEGCSLKEVTASSIRCSCTHLTDFAAFFKTGLSVLEDSNYAVFLVLPELTLSNLLSNIGFYFAIGYWSLFTPICLALSIADRKRRKRSDFF